MSVMTLGSKQWLSQKKSYQGPEGRGGSRATAWQGVETSNRGQPSPSASPMPRTFQKHRSLRHRRAQTTTVWCCAHDWFYSQAGIKWGSRFPYKTGCFCARIGQCATLPVLPRHVRIIGRCLKACWAFYQKQMLAQILGSLPRMTTRESKGGRRNEMAADSWHGWLGTQHLPSKVLVLWGLAAQSNIDQHEVTAHRIGWDVYSVPPIPVSK